MPHQIKSPIPGTFYRKPSPEDPPFKSEGDAVAKGDVIGLVEVMKTFHNLQADADGTLSTFDVDDGEAVAPGQVIATLE
ncbi:MAG: acetyl-CoA carboxylase [Pseudomonadota bacterium]